MILELLILLQLRVHSAELFILLEIPAVVEAVAG